MAHPKKGYWLPDGTKAAGTTTVIGRFKESGGLLWWAFEQGKAAERGEINSLYDKRDEAGLSGTGVHFMVWMRLSEHFNADLSKIDVLDMGDDGKITLTDDVRNEIQTGFDAYMQWERMTKLTITHQEIQLVCPKYRFGGTPDAIGLIEDEPCLIDWKTSKKIYSDMLIQLAAYGWLIEHGLQQQHDYKPLGIKVKGFHLCKFSKHSGDFSHHYFPQLDIEWEQFKLLRVAYDNDKIIKQRAA